MMKVSAIVVTIGAKDYISFCLGSLLNQTCLPCEIIVIDNSLNPDLARKINKLYPSIKVYPSSDNLFYGASLNKGIEKSSGEFILCLNDDVVLDKNFIQEALNGFLSEDKIGLVSGKLLRADGKTLDSTGLFLTFWRTARERGYGRPDSKKFNNTGLIFGVSGAAAFYRREMLEEIKEGDAYFDPRFLMFYEDLDISWRAQKCGWRAYYIPAALIYHVRGGSFRPDSGINKAIARRYLDDQLHYELIKNRYLTILKNESRLSLFLHLIPILIYDFCAWVYVLFFRPKVAKLCFEKIYKGSLPKKRF
jgi:GT2 family glycosyltransferase